MAEEESFASKLTAVDLFGIIPNLTFQGRRKIYSRLGFILTILVCAFLLLMIVFLFRGLVQRTSPTFVQSQLIGATVDQSLKFSKDSFYFAIGLYDTATNSYFVDPNIYTVDVILYLAPSFTRKPDWTEYKLDLELCAPAHFKEEFTYDGQLLCFSQKQIGNGDIFVQIRDKVSISYQFSKCDNTVAGNTCESDTDITAKLKRSSFVGFHPYWSIDPKDFDNPLKSARKMQKTPLMPSYTKAFFLNLNTVRFVSNDGLLLDASKNETVIGVESFDVDVMENQGDLVFLEGVIQNSGNRIDYDRSYPKVQDVLAQVSGLAGTAIVVVGTIVGPYAEVRMKQHLCNQIYNFKVKQGGETVKVQGKKKGKKGQDASVSSPKDKQGKQQPESSEKKSPKKKGKNKEQDQEVIAQKNDSSHKVIELQEVEFQLQQNQGMCVQESAGDDVMHQLPNRTTDNIEVGVWDWLKSFVKPEPQARLLEKGSEEILKGVDIVTIVTKFYEIEKLKACLMNDDQRALFDHLPKALLVLDADQDAKSQDAIQVHDWSKSYSSEKSKLSEIYNKLKRADNKSKLDERLLSLYEKDDDK